MSCRWTSPTVNVPIYNHNSTITVAGHHCKLIGDSYNNYRVINSLASLPCMPRINSPVGLYNMEPRLICTQDGNRRGVDR